MKLPLRKKVPTRTVSPVSPKKRMKLRRRKVSSPEATIDMPGAPKVKPKSGGLLPWSVQHVLSSKKTPGIVLLVFGSRERSAKSKPGDGRC